MKTESKIGIWMDHSTAHLIEFTTEPMETTSIDSPFTHDVKVDTVSGKSEHLMHNKEQHQQAAFYKQLGEVIKGYTDVILFGSTDAKLELRNILCADHLFDKIKIETQQADKMTDAQQHAFVKHHFANHHLFHQN